MHHYKVPQEFCPVHHIYTIEPEDESLPIRYIDNTNHVTTIDTTLVLR